MFYNLSARLTYLQLDYKLLNHIVTRSIKQVSLLIIKGHSTQLLHPISRLTHLQLNYNLVTTRLTRLNECFKQVMSRLIKHLDRLFNPIITTPHSACLTHLQLDYNLLKPCLTLLDKCLKTTAFGLHGFKCVRIRVVFNTNKYICGVFTFNKPSKGVALWGREGVVDTPNFSLVSGEYLVFV
ncbi:hypothetical protein Hanom_Chr01g00029271 [Helianthus anomalus]